MTPVISPLQSFYYVGLKQELPKDALLLLFAQCNEQDLARCRMVCRRWNQIGNDERVTKKFAFAFGAKDWVRCFGAVGIEPLLPESISEILEAPCPFWKGKKVKETHLLVLIPKTVNGNPFTLTSLGVLVEEPKQGYKAKQNYYSDEIKSQHGDKILMSSYWALITRGVVPGSRNKSYGEQQALLAKHRGYGIPKLLEAATSVLTHHVKSGERLYDCSSKIYTRCQEKYPGCSWHCEVGGFNAAACLQIYCFDYDHRDVGVGAVRKL